MRIILIETSTTLCSTALAEDGKIVAVRESSGPREHASLTAPFVKEMLDEKGLRVCDCDAVCVSMGPGSYTGLRVGVSTAKGLCFGGGIPLLAIDSLKILFHQAEGAYKYIVPMIDARRMEVYTTVYSHDGQQITEIEPMIVTQDSFQKELQEGPVLFIGDGALKCREVLTNPNASFVQTCPRASAMLEPAMRAFEAGEFKNVAYFEPLYIKQFVAKVSNKNVLVPGAEI